MNANFFLAIASSLAFAASGCAEQPDKPPFAESYVEVSAENPDYLCLSNGDTYIPIGCNIAAIGNRPLMESYMESLHANGGNFARVWLNSGLFEIEKEYGVWNGEAVSNIDRLLELALLYDIKVKMCIESFRHIRPGRNQWNTKASYHTSNGGPFADIHEYLNTEKGHSEFLRRLGFLHERYGDHPAVFGWELWNEMNAVEHRDIEDIYRWTELMLAEVKGMFPKNLAMQSLGSHDRPWCLPHYDRVMAMPGNEVAQVHRYVDLGAEFDECKAPVDVMASDAVEKVRGMKTGKPVLLAETGAVKPSHTGPHPMYAVDSLGVVIHDALFAAFFAGAAGPGHMWHWDHYIDRQDVWFQMKRFANAVRGFDPVAEKPRPVRLDTPRMRVYALKGNDTSLIWCRDASSGWASEFEQGIAPLPLSGQTLDLTPLTDGRRVKSVDIYDPWKDEWSRAGASEMAALPEFTRSLVVKVSY